MRVNITTEGNDMFIMVQDVNGFYLELDYDNNIEEIYKSFVDEEWFFMMAEKFWENVKTEGDNSYITLGYYTFNFVNESKHYIEFINYLKRVSDAITAELAKMMEN